MTSILSDITYVLELKHYEDFSNITKNLYDKIRQDVDYYHDYHKYLRDTKDIESVKQYYRHVLNHPYPDNEWEDAINIHGIMDKELADFIVNNDMIFNRTGFADYLNYHMNYIMGYIMAYNPNFLLDKRMDIEPPFYNDDGTINFAYVMDNLDLKGAALSNEFIDTIKSESSKEEIIGAIKKKLSDGDSNVSFELLKDLKSFFDKEDVISLLRDDNSFNPDSKLIKSLIDDYSIDIENIKTNIRDGTFEKIKEGSIDDVSGFLDSQKREFAKIAKGLEIRGEIKNTSDHLKEFDTFKEEVIKLYESGELDSYSDMPDIGVSDMVSRISSRDTSNSSLSDTQDESFINSLFDELQTRPILYSVLFTGTALVTGGLLYRKKKNKIERSVNLISKKYDIDPKIIYFFTDIYYDFRFLIKKQLFRKKQYLEKLHTSFELFQNHINKHPKKSKILNDIKNDEFMDEMNEHFYNKRRSSDINEKIYNLLKSKNISKGQFKSELSIESDQNTELLSDIELLLHE